MLRRPGLRADCINIFEAADCAIPSPAHPLAYPPAHPLAHPPGLSPWPIPLAHPAHPGPSWPILAHPGPSWLLAGPKKLGPLTQVFRMTGPGACPLPASQA